MAAFSQARHLVMLGKNLQSRGKDKFYVAIALQKRCPALLR